MPRSYLMILIGAMLWGTISIAGKIIYGLGEVSPIMLGWMRMVVAAPLLWGLTLWLDRGHSWRMQRADWPWWLLAMASMGGYQLFVFAAVQRTAVTTAIMLAICTSPMLVALAAPFVLGEKLMAKTLRAGALIVAGAVLVLGIGNVGNLVRSDYVTGNLLALGAAACWATYVLVARRLVQNNRVTRVTALTFAGAVLLVAPLALQTPAVHLPPLGWVLAFYLGTIPTALSYYLYVRGLQGATATVSSFLTLAEPGTAALLAALLLGERLTAGGWVGVALLVLGLLSLR